MTRHALAAAAFAALTFPAAATAAPEDVALRYVREHRAQIGLDAADLSALRPPAVTTAGNITTVRWRQAVDGIPAADSELRVNLAPDGRVLNVVGDPAHDLDANTTPAVTAGEAVRAVQDDVGVFRSAPRDRGPNGATRATAYADGTTAELALDDRRLVWRVTYRATSSAVYDAFVDARSGKVRRSVNMVKSVTNALVWENRPGTAPGGAQAVRNLEQSSWLAAGAGRLSGRNVHAFSDLDDDDFPDAAEEVAPGSYAFEPVTGGAICTVAKPCSWTGAPNSWQTNREQSAVQAFYFANRFHDHLAAAPINFSDSSFDGGDALQLHTNDGAGGPGGSPNSAHVNNANMFTPPDGKSPVMQMYLWQPPGRRAANGSDDASIVYHEYTHGLSNRLVTDAAGRGALNSPQAGAMGEGWSDWYAKDFLVSQFPALDTAAAGDVDMGEYVDFTPHSLRSQGLDCPVGASPVACPGAGLAGTGGYTYGDFGKIAGEQEVHADGEIWAETLWDLRTAVGSADARRLITEGMRLSPPEPSFLDMRNAILLADQAAGGARRTAIWTVFSKRGMGYAASTNEATAEPLQDFSMPPTPGEPRGRIAGTVRDAAGGQPLAGGRAAISGLAEGPDALAGTTGADGSFAIESVPARTFPSMIFTVPAYDTVVQPVTVSAGATTTTNVTLHRNWAAFVGGATITPGPNAGEYADQGCGPDAAVDQRQGTGWSTEAAPGGKSMVVTLPQPIDVSAFLADPAEACGDDSRSATRDYVIETSTTTADGPWSAAAAGAFGDDARHKLTEIAAPVAGVRHVRLTLLSSQGNGAFLDFSEFAVRGTPVAQPPTPTPTPTSAPTVAPPSFSFPARGRTTVKFKVTCAAACDVTAKLTVDRPTAKKLGLGKVLTAGSLTTRVNAGKTTLTLKLKSKARKALLKGPKKRTYRARLKATATYGPGNAPVSRSGQLTLKR